jgi:hypothetical protein
MATRDSVRSEYIQALPTLSQASDLIGIDPSGMTRAVKRLGLEPIAWGGREKHLAVTDLLRVASHAQRASLEEVAGALLEWAEHEHPTQVERLSSDIDDFFASLPEPQARERDAFVAELRAALPKPWAARAEEIWRAHLEDSPAQASQTK